MKFISLLLLATSVLAQDPTPTTDPLDTGNSTTNSTEEEEPVEIEYGICPRLMCISDTMASVEDEQMQLDIERGQSDLIGDRCYSIQGEVPIKNPIYAKECFDESRSKSTDTPMFCSFDLTSGEYSWMDEDLMDPSIVRSSKVSHFQHKKIDGYCKEVRGLRQNLLPGRNCTEQYQCRSKKCKEEICVGLGKDDNCYNHEDCENGLYCRMSDNWPFQATCSKVNTIYEVCTSDYQCQNNQFCWYPDVQSRENEVKNCLPMYSLDDGATFGWQSESDTEITADDFTRNGLYCASGLAYPTNETMARCTSFEKMIYNDTEIEYPFPCNATSRENQCQLYFNVEAEDEAYTNDPSAKRNYVANSCKCSLDGSKSGGYCSSLIGTEKYAKAMAAKQIVMDASNCHTLDRHDLRAQKDSKCGIGTGSDQLRFAVDQIFNVTHHPYVQNIDTYYCTRRFFRDSYDTLILEEARFGVSLNLAKIATFIAVVMLAFS